MPGPLVQGGLYWGFCPVLQVRWFVSVGSFWTVSFRFSVFKKKNPYLLFIHGSVAKLGLQSPRPVCLSVALTSPDSQPFGSRVRACFGVLLTCLATAEGDIKDTATRWRGFEPWTSDLNESSALPNELTCLPSGQYQEIIEQVGQVSVIGSLTLSPDSGSVLYNLASRQTHSWQAAPPVAGLLRCFLYYERFWNSCAQPSQTHC